MRRFRIAVPEEDLEDLRRRIDLTRWPAELPDVGWSRGVPLRYIRELADYWRTGFDWRAAEERINGHPQFITGIDNTDVHFLHARSPEPDALPLVITHGWPGSFVEFLDVIGPLTDPRAHGGDPSDAFHVVVPTLPGFGFSGPTGRTGWDTWRVARAWAELMERLGYRRYGVQGGDWGMPISLRVGLVAPRNVVGAHLNLFVTLPPSDPAATAGLDGEDLARLEKFGHFLQDGLGWQKIQSTRPQTLAYALTDSPVGQLAWIVEKFKEWSDSVDSPEDAVDRDLLLTVVTIYWLTATAGSSAQLYFESSRSDRQFVETWGGPWPLEAPVGVAVFPGDATPPVRAFAEELLPTLTRWTEFDRGGHFAAVEQPASFVDDVRAFFRPLR